MHEGSLMRGLLRAVEAAAAGAPVKAVGVRVGALAGISPAHLREHWHEHCAEVRLEVTEGEDPAEEHAQGVVVEWVEVEG